MRKSFYSLINPPPNRTFGRFVFGAVCILLFSIAFILIEFIPYMLFMLPFAWIADKIPSLTRFIMGHYEGGNFFRVHMFWLYFLNLPLAWISLYVETKAKADKLDQSALYRLSCRLALFYAFGMLPAFFVCAVVGLVPPLGVFLFAGLFGYLWLAISGWNISRLSCGGRF